jgi:DNA-binding GntR family transcriptional regulator
MARPITQRALYEDVAERVRQLIFRGELAPGAWIDERALVARFGISRTPLREALKVLHAEGLVRLTPRRGSFVASELTPQDLDEIFPLMALLEGLCALEAVRKATPEDVRRLEALHARLERHAVDGDLERYYEQNYAFHEAVQRLAANPWLSRTVSELRRFIRLLRGRQLRVRGRLAASLAEHRRFIRALRRRDAEEAERVMRAHVMAQRAALAVQDATSAAPSPRRREQGGSRSLRRGSAGTSPRAATTRPGLRTAAAPRARATTRRRGSGTRRGT